MYKKQWRDADWDMRTALATYENMWQKLRRAEQSGPVLNSLEVPNCIPSACPQVASVLYSIDTETLDWLTETYLWGEVAHYGPSSDGWNRPQEDRMYTAAEKLEQLISETHAQREAHCDNLAEQISKKTN